MAPKTRIRRIRFQPDRKAKRNNKRFEVLSKKQKKDVEMTKFEDLPNEIILKIFSHLSIKDLFRCMAMNKRIKDIANDESLWEIIHLTGDVPAELLKQIIDKGCKYMALYKCHVKRADVRFEKNFKLKYLSLERCVEDPDENFDILPNLAASCHNLEKFSVYRCDNPHSYYWDNDYEHIHPNIFQCIIQNSGTLKVLSLNELMLDSVSAQHIFTHCNELIELSIELGEWCEESINFMCKNLTNKIEKLHLFGQENFKNEELKKLLTRCNKLTEFGFSAEYLDDFDAIIENLSETLVKIEPLMTKNINFSQLLRLASMPNLKVLYSTKGHITKESEKRIKKALPHLEISHQPWNVASPYPNRVLDLDIGFWEIKAKPFILE